MSSTKCEICLNNDHKYKCPRCSMKTCSLACCKTHKSNTGCTGERDKTKFIAKEEFDEQALLSDYKYLEEQTRLIDAYQRTIEQLDSPLKSNESKGPKMAPSGAYENMRKFVKSQFNINLRLMPTQSSRHANNKTRFNRSTNAISWSLEFVFHLDQTKIESTLKSSLFRFHSKASLFASSETLKCILMQMYSRFKDALFENIYKGSDDAVSNDDTQSICLIKTFSSILKEENFTDLHVLFDVIDFYLKKKYFIKLDLNAKLDECLRNKTLIEYPTLYLVTTSNLNKYLIQDETQDAQCSSKNVSVEQSKKGEVEETQMEEEEEGENDEEIDSIVNAEENDSDSSTSESEELFHKNANSSQTKVNASDQCSNGNLAKKVKVFQQNEDYEIEEGEELDSD
jgi:hypothetical protein